MMVSGWQHSSLLPTAQSTGLGSPPLGWPSTLAWLGCAPCLLETSQPRGGGVALDKLWRVESGRKQNKVPGAPGGRQDEGQRLTPLG